MQMLYELARGPLVWISVLIFVCGIAVRALQLFSLTRRKERLLCPARPAGTAPPAATDEEKKILGVLEDMTTSQRAQGANVPRDDGRFLRMLVESMDAKNVVEIGTSNGYSGIWMASARWGSAASRSRPCWIFCRRGSSATESSARSRRSKPAARSISRGRIARNSRSRVSWAVGAVDMMVLI
mgnify:CR=1 FL=1